MSISIVTPPSYTSAPVMNPASANAAGNSGAAPQPQAGQQASALVGSAQYIPVEVCTGTVVLATSVATSGTSFEFYEDPYLRFRLRNTGAMAPVGFAIDVNPKIALDSAKMWTKGIQGGNSVFGFDSSNSWESGWYQSTIPANSYYAAPNGTKANVPDTGFWGAASRTLFMAGGLPFVYEIEACSRTTPASFILSISRIPIVGLLTVSTKQTLNY